MVESVPDTHFSTGVVARLAPSPTGGLHLGHARTFLIAWLAARHASGRVILRIEDLDATRARGEAREGLLVDLRWLGLDWDEGPDVGGPGAPYVQSQRSSFYDAFFNDTAATESVYPCTCTRADVERAAGAPHPEEEGPSYPGTCAQRTVADALALADSPFAWRFRVRPGAVVWDDLFLGPMALDPSRTGGDFIVGRPGVGFSYQLAVVADDAEMGVNQVIRGNDLVTSTPRQILLYRRLGWPVPRFGHVPLAIGSDGRRLAKRDGSLKLAALREAGVDPCRLIGCLVHTCGWSSSIIPSWPADWIDRFSTASIPPQNWVVTPKWLDSLRAN